MGDKKQAKNSKATLKILQEKAKEKYPKAKVSDLGEEWWDNLSARENSPSI